MEKKESFKELFRKRNTKIDLIYNQPLENGTTYYFHISLIKDEKLYNIQIEPFEFYPKLEELLGSQEAKKIWGLIKPKIVDTLDIELGNFIKTQFNHNKKTFKIIEFPKCALCQEPKDLRKSHIVPKFISNWIKNTSKTGKLRDLDYKRIQDSLKIFLLCKECEQKLSKFEKYFADKIFHPTVNLTSNDVKYNVNLLKFIVSVSWRVLQSIPILKKQNLEEISGDLVGCEKNWRDFLNDRAKNPLSSHYLLHTVCMLDYFKQLKKKWQFFTQRSVAHGYDNYNGVDFIWCQFPYYLIISPVNPLYLTNYNQCLIKEKGLYKELCAVNLEKFDFIGFVFSKIDQFNQEIKKSKST